MRLALGTVFNGLSLVTASRLKRLLGRNCHVHRAEAPEIMRMGKTSGLKTEKTRKVQPIGCYS